MKKSYHPHKGHSSQFNLTFYINTLKRWGKLNRHFHLYFLVRFITNEVKVICYKRVNVFLLSVYLQNLQYPKKKKNTLNIDEYVFIPQPSFVIIGNLQEKVLVGSEAALGEASREFDTHEHPQLHG